MKVGKLRIVLSLGLFAFLFVFFVPVVYDATMFRCINGSLLCLTNPSGWKSLGYWTIHWGAAYSPGGAGDPQLMGYTFLSNDISLPAWLCGPGSFGGRLTAFGMLLFVALPATLTASGLLAPEINKGPQVARVGFIAFEAFILALSGMMFASMASQGFLPMLALLGWLLGSSSALMILYGLRLWIFRPVESNQEEQPAAVSR